MSSPSKCIKAQRTAATSASTRNCSRPRTRRAWFCCRRATTPTTLAVTTITGTADTNWTRATIGTNLFVTGTNILAVEVHQAATNSSDLGFDLELSATLQPALTIVHTSTNYLLRWPAAA